MSEKIKTPAFVTISSELWENGHEDATKITELKEKLLRMAADWDNSRKRMQREKEEAIKYAGEGLLEQLLPIIDNFELGLQASQTATDAKSIAQGFQMVFAQLQQFLRETGLQPIDAVGQPFDPHLHEALGHQESTDHKEGTVISQARKGYKLKDRLFRPATVFVAKAPESELQEQSR